MWIVIDLCEFEPNHAIVVADENGQNLLFDTDEQAERWAIENCAWNWRVVEI